MNVSEHKAGVCSEKKVEEEVDVRKRARLSSLAVVQILSLRRI